ncbi:hypothetical protein P170DRAFT_511278 [Aspergillus steynii IBT 23096]|uniref:F-box domain-containing protein n=1 Tax=Aspergillus steynii IBT 23096 TaxID=1392250 RepID=A0A2I2G0X2_9EURO|nr:uncharacterized protein P170DRAFT_511278 [Aspergillus steynii IBT 23096]PLB46530.1 hypothetical protein P170DRAFT_511278 [Aspergillus steynii IBT 23096]
MQEQPQTKVLITPELLEIILLHLDTRTLLVSAQRVCRTWTALIQTSPAIQQALFFQQTARNPNLERDKWNTESIWHSLLPSRLQENGKIDQGSINGYESPHPPRIYNPLLVQAFPPFFPPIHDNEEKATETETQTEHEGREKENEISFSFKPLDMLSSPQKKTAYMRKEASWRKMLLCQPPVDGGVAVFKVIHSRIGDSYSCYKVPQKTPRPHQEERVDHGDILKMDHFFTTLTQNPDVYFRRLSETHVYWSAYVPPCDPDISHWHGGIYPPRGGSFNPRVKKAFAEAIEKFEVVIYSMAMLECDSGEERVLTDEECLREEIVEAETEESKEREK